MTTRIQITLLCLLMAVAENNINAQIFIGETAADTMTVVSGLDTPWEILWGPDHHIWITERYGRISRLDPQTGEIKEVAVIDDVHEQGESGLLGMTLHPDFASTPHLFLVYNYLEMSSIKERLVRYTYDDGTLTNPVTLLDRIAGAGNHNGSRLAIDSANMLYMTTGDAANTSTSQDLNSLNGKVLRMNLDGSVPGDNPIPGSPIWSWGHRNPQGLVFAPSGILYSSEHGPSSDDEVNIIEKGRNYGWPNVKGFCDELTESQFCSDSGVDEPIAAWTPTLAVSGADFYAHSAIPEWNRSVLVTSLKASRLVALKVSSDGRSVLDETQFFQNWFGRLRDLCISPAGEVYLAVSNRDGRGTVRAGDDRILKISARDTVSYCTGNIEAVICPGEIYDFHGTKLVMPGIYLDTIAVEEGCDSIISLTLRYHERGEIGLQDAYTLSVDDSVTLQANPGFVSYAWNGNAPSTSESYTLSGAGLGAGTHNIVIEAVDLNGCVLTDSVVVTVTGTTGIQEDAGDDLRIFPNPLRGSELTIAYSPSENALLSIYNEMGSQIAVEVIYPGSSRTTLFLPDTKGLYLLRITDGNRVISRKIVKY